MVRLCDLKAGDKVHYQPSHYLKDDKWENGIVKSVPEFSLSSVRVVYNCLGDWENYKDYTSALTNVSDLNHGWRPEGSKNLKPKKEEDEHI
jgi:hypothetical protein